MNLDSPFLFETEQRKCFVCFEYYCWKDRSYRHCELEHRLGLSLFVMKESSAMTCHYIIRLLQMISSINFKADSNRFDRFLNKNKSDFVKKEFL